MQGEEEDEKSAFCITPKGMSLQREPEGQGAHARMTGGGGGGEVLGGGPGPPQE